MRLLASVVAVAVLLAGCSGDDDAATSEADRDRFPPGTADALRPLFADELGALELRLTRASLVATETDYSPSRRGTHLAVYVEPTSGSYSNADYITGLHRATDVFAPEVFERWPGLESFDVCQEPRPGDDDRETPTPLTQVNLTRAQAAEIDWDRADAATVVAASLAQPTDEKILRRLDLELTRDPLWADVQARARELAGR